MFKKVFVACLAVCVLYLYHSFTGPKQDTQSIARPPYRAKQIEKGSFHDFRLQTLKYLPDKQTWPEPVRVAYYLAFMEEAIDPIRLHPDFLPLDNIGMNVQHAIIAVEDHNFYQHSAVSMEGILRAVMVNASAGEILQGGSTLTQQLVKNLFLTQEQTFNRKIMEAMLAMVMENRYSKDEILELYLNATYFGMECKGINRAAGKLFGKSPLVLRLEEAALLAGLPNAPEALNPFLNPTNAKKRQEIVLDSLQKHGFITQQQCWRAKAAVIELINGDIIQHEDRVAL